MVDVALYSLAEALSDLQLRHQNRLFSANVVLFGGPKQASSSEIEAGWDPVRERVKIGGTQGHSFRPYTAAINRRVASKQAFQIKFRKMSLMIK